MEKFIKRPGLALVLHDCWTHSVASGPGKGSWLFQLLAHLLGCVNKMHGGNTVEDDQHLRESAGSCAKEGILAHQLELSLTP